jgi:hypothetical protein
MKQVGLCAAYRGMVGKLDGKRPLGRPKHRGRIILNWILKNYNGRTGWHRLDYLAVGSCENGNES